MAGLPEFSKADQARLAKLGVSAGQIEQLRYARLDVRRGITRSAARNKVAKVLDDVAKLSDRLLKKTAAINTRAEPAEALAYTRIEEGYWNRRPGDDGGTSFNCLAPRLKALRDAATEAKNALPPTATRHRTASPKPVKAIAEALQYGWTKEHGDGVFTMRFVDGESVKTYDHPNGAHPKPYPTHLIARATDNSAFRQIVGICYEAEGGTEDPLAAIRAYLEMEGKSRRETIAAVEARIAATDGGGNRTS